MTELKQRNSCEEDPRCELCNKTIPKHIEEFTRCLCSKCNAEVDDIASRIDATVLEQLADRVLATVDIASTEGLVKQFVIGLKQFKQGRVRGRN